MIVECKRTELNLHPDNLIKTLEFYKSKFDGVFASIGTDEYYKTYDVTFTWYEER